MYKILNLIIVILFCIPFLTKAQQNHLSQDSLPVYNFGVLRGKTTKFKKHVNFKQSTYFFQEKYANGDIASEYYKDSDSTYLHISFHKRKEPKYRQHKRCEGLLLVTNITKGDTITNYDYETGEQRTLIDRLMTPIGEWIFYDINGKVVSKGTYSTDGKENEWITYCKKKYHRNKVNKIVHYDKDIMQKVDTVNLLLHEDIHITQKAIEGAWGVVTTFKGTKYILGRGSTLERMIKDGRVLYFERDKLLRGRTDGMTVSPKVYQDVKRKWELVDYNTLKLTHNDQSKNYNIIYLSKDSFILEQAEYDTLNLFTRL